MQVLGICGSLRKGSFNRALLENFRKVLPSEVNLKTALLHTIPIYNEDDEKIAFPASVLALSDDVIASDFILFAVPEYNYSIPGVLKNAIDWVSRHPKKPFAGKKAAIMGASSGKIGTARAQYHLRQVGVFLDLRFINRPEVMVAEAHTKFDAQGQLIDEATLAHLKKLAEAIVAS